MNIALIGYGKMGHMIESICKERGHNIVSIIDVDNQDDFESAAFASADVAIEFTSPTAAYSNYLRAWKAGVKVVSGSTGWMKDHGDDVRRACTEEGKTLFWASNFSIGVAIFSAVNRYLAKIMNQFSQYDVRMSETHHVHKLDAPSGTAITLAEEIIADLDRKTSWVKGEQHLADGTVEGTNNAAPDQLPIESTRARDSHSVRCSLPNTPRSTRDCSPQRICSSSNIGGYGIPAIPTDLFPHPYIL